MSDFALLLYTSMIPTLLCIYNNVYDAFYHFQILLKLKWRKIGYIPEKAEKPKSCALFIPNLCQRYVIFGSFCILNWSG